MTNTTVLFANDATSNLAGSITNVATTANLTPGGGTLFPAPGANEYFVGTFVDAATGLLKEIIHVTNVTGDTITMVRGQEGTTALNWSAGDSFSNLLTAGTAGIFRQTGVGITLDDLTNASSGTADNGGLGVMHLWAGDPNGHVAGNANVNGASDVCYDTTNSIWYVCTISGNATAAVWSSLSSGGVPIGAGMEYWGDTAPSNYVFSYGQALSRTGFAALFAVYGTKYGAGDGSTTFNVPDKRGRGSFVNDAMGGTPANRIQVSTTISTTNASNSATVASAAGLALGMKITSANVPAGAAITAISGTTITMSANASATAAGTAARFSIFGDAEALGANGGENTHTQVLDELVAHTHQIPAAGTSANGITAGADLLNNTFGGKMNSAASGNGLPFNVLPPGIVCNYIIRVS